MIKTLQEYFKNIKSKEKKNDESSLLELARSFLIAIILALVFRSFAYEPFHIPSGSMKPTLLVGDYIFVSKFSYGYSKYSLPFGLPIIKGRIFFTEPKRGDVIVFKLPKYPSINYIKRLVGLPGDKIQVKKGVLYLNDVAVPRKKVDEFKEKDTEGYEVYIDRYIETLPNGVSYEVLDQLEEGDLDNTGVYVVPPGHYFFMGDNRDNSADSRVVNGDVGYVPEENLVGRAGNIFFSTTASLFKFWEWIPGLRTSRFFKKIAYE